ncbi:MAG: glycine zipper domain-containing protein [Verrucomicrobiota bacterium]
MKAIVICLLGIGLAAPSVQAEDTIFGREGSGRPTNTVVGALFGAATGAAIGQATGGKDGWWIGSLVGTAVGGTIGNTVPTDSYRRDTYRPTYASYRPRYHRTYSRSSYCPPYRSRPVVQQVVYEQPVVVEKTVIATDISPYGHMQNDGTIKSPWSDFTMSVGGLSPGQTVYDGYTGKAFRVP